MFFTDKKTTTLRLAIAEAFLKASPATLEIVRSNQVPKGNAIELARAAGVMAAKKTPELLPYCHPIPLDGVKVDFEILSDCIRVTSLAKAVWKTGLEMEALTAASVAALTLYDMLKPLDSNLEITGIRLLEKEGGKSDFKEKIPQPFLVAVMVTSDGTHQGKRQDNSGKLICARLAEFGINDVDYVILPDDQDLIQKKLGEWCEKEFHLILTTGGTGLGPRDVTVEATRLVIDREVPGIAETMRSFGQAKTPYAMLSRGLAGLKSKTLIINLPGSSKGVEESMDAIFPAVLHGYKMMAGGGH